MAERKPIRRALVSVYDKDRLLELGALLASEGIEIISTGSTAKTLQGAAKKVGLCGFTVLKLVHGRQSQAKGVTLA